MRIESILEFLTSYRLGIRLCRTTRMRSSEPQSFSFTFQERSFENVVGDTTERRGWVCVQPPKEGVTSHAIAHDGEEWPSVSPDYEVVIDVRVFALRDPPARGSSFSNHNRIDSNEFCSYLRA